MPTSTMIALMNTILDNASAEYASRVPVATASNITAVGAPILTFQATQNEFLNALINKIVMQIVNSKIAQNPLKVLKKGGMPLGMYAEEMIVNPAKASHFDPTGAGLLTVTKPDLKTQYHAMNRQDVYTVTISSTQLQTAFSAWSKLEELISAITGSLYSGDNYDEFVLMKGMIEVAILGDKVVTIECTPVTDLATAKDFVKAVKTTSMLMSFPSGNFNKYLANKPASDLSTDPLITWTPPEDQVLIIRADVMAHIDIEVLAVAFNLSKVQLEQMTLIIDSFGGDPAYNDVYALLADKAFFKVFDNKVEMAEFYNGHGLYWNYFYHHWQTYSYSLFANAVAFVKDLAVILSGVPLAIAVGEAGATVHTVDINIAGSLFNASASVLGNWTITGEVGTKVGVTSIVVSADKKKVTVTTTNSAGAVAGEVTMIPKAVALSRGEVPAVAFVIATVA